MAAPQRTHTSTRLLGILALLGCGKDEPKLSTQPPSPPAQDAAAVAAPTDAGDNKNKITITVDKPKAPGSGLAKRCAISGPPLETPCTGSSTGIAFDKAGVLYLVNEKQLRRFNVTEPCTLAPEGEPLELPPDNPRPQPLGKGPVYMRSGGVAWELVQTPDAIYAHDFLVGLFRVDRGKPEPTCTE